MNLRRLLLSLLALAAVAVASRPWTEAEFRAFERTWQPQWSPRPESLIRGPRRFNYLERIKLTCDFIARFQVSDSGSSDFGGIIEAEHLPSIIETDNTQEAIWVWTRWFELTGRDDYRVNVRRAWTYVLNHPAYWEHNGDPQYLWYSVWNSGLAFMAESKYRSVYGDSSFIAYADSCRGFYLNTPLTPAMLDLMVTAQSSGMAYSYALGRGDQLLRDSALARGNRVRLSIESGPRARLAAQNWAMCGGTMFWGVAHTYCLADTVAGKAWLATYAESLPGFYPTGTWNSSHNIWLANAYRSAAELTGDDDWWLMHHYLTDTLLQKDTDRDGGIPANWTDPPTLDQTWISTYLVFMGMDPLASPVLEHDLSALEFAAPSGRQLYQVGDSVDVAVPVANVGRTDEPQFNLTVFGPGYSHTLSVPALAFLGIDTIQFPRLGLTEAGMFQLDAVSQATPDDNRLNDTSRTSFKVYGRYVLSGTLLDSLAGLPIRSGVLCRIAGSSSVWDSTGTDSLGRFSLDVADTSFVVTIAPEPPYYGRSWPLTITGDTAAIFLTPAAHLMVVNADTLGQYDGYYTSTLDSVGVTWFAWHRQAQGLPPYHLVDRLRARTIVWFSGDAIDGTVPAEDQDSLLSLAQAGFNLLLTGQNIGEDIAGSVLLEELCGTHFDSTGWSQFFVYGHRPDSLGSLIGATSTAGGDGAGNQNSRDVLSAMRNGASLFMVYDTLTGKGAGIRRRDPSGTKTIVLGFGFEAVNRPQSRPTFLTRVQLMRKLLDWFNVFTGVEEPELPQSPVARTAVVPNPFSARCRVLAPAGARLSLFDASGRRLCPPLTAPLLAERLSACLPGTYFLLDATPGNSPSRVVKVN